MSTVSFKNSARQFKKRLKEFGDKSEERLRLTFLGSVQEAYKSVKYGSEVTGAPGQPVKTGRLRASWRMTGTARSGNMTIETDVPYAPIIEDNRRNATLRSKVGGWHSVKITRLNYRLIVAKALREAKAKVPMK